MGHARSRGEPLSVRLRAATRYEHERAEASPFPAGLPDRGAWAALPGRSHHFRTALEQAGEVWRHDGVVGPFVRPAPPRSKPTWPGSPAADRFTAPDPLPATRRYVDRCAPARRRRSSRTTAPATSATCSAGGSSGAGSPRTSG
ncbi:hypothetical protein JOE68_005621 [Saccharothrix algeriensis]|uniref:Uncharacterized protein n=1 Tax=Saccharothrix algeriensis TaxID=173560 RepID=A0ABS2SEQ4_9PSEU|nr:hypothetical protein [Saccharothrix algeriensis]MBM7814756.1 hypothetical protein [Saccharothrix algeriensis]